MPYCETGDGTRLFSTDWGAGPPVVFLHSWAFSADMGEYQTMYLVARGLRCIAYDRRGHGRSDQPGYGYDYDTRADDLAALLAHLDLRGVTLVGHSMGGAEIVRYLSRHGDDRIARVALVSAVLPFLLRTADTLDGGDRGVFDAARAAMRSDFPRWRRTRTRSSASGCRSAPSRPKRRNGRSATRSAPRCRSRSPATTRSPRPISVPNWPRSPCRRSSSTAMRIGPHPSR